MKIKFYLMFFGVLVLLFSCTTTKTFTNKNVKQLSHSDILDSLEFYKKDFISYSSKVSINLAADKSLNLKGNIRIKKDSLIWISLSPGLGFEVARILLKPDSVFVLDRVRNTFYYGSYSYFQKVADVDLDFNSIQALLLNELFIYHPTISDTAVFNKMIISFDKIGNKIKLQSLRNRDLRKIIKKDENPDLLYQDMTINEDWNIENSSINDFKFDRKIAIHYYDYLSTDSISNPTHLDISIKNIDKTIELKFEFSKIEYNLDNKYPFSIPNKYERVMY